LALLALLALAACPGNAPPAKAPCDAATLAKLTAECSVEAYSCGAAGVPKDQCAPMIACNQKLDDRKEQCR
jgi:hypothetical protein